MFGDARAKLKSGPNKGEPTAKAQDYAFRLAVERISGKPLDGGFETWQMRRGHELEPQARMEHEVSNWFDRHSGGTGQDRRRCISEPVPDGFIGEDGGAEYKCFLAPEKLRSFHIDNDASEIMDQVQGCMWITGRKWWHIGMYCPDLKVVGRQLWWKEFQRDDDYIEKLEEDLWQFKLLVDGYEEILRSKAA